MVLMVALLSDEKSRRSEFVVSLKPTTRGPPALPVPLRYSFTLDASKTAVVLSKLLAPSRLGLSVSQLSEERWLLLGGSDYRSWNYSSMSIFKYFPRLKLIYEPIFGKSI